MTFEGILDQVIAMLQRRGRVLYRTLKLQFKLDDETLEALKEELFYSQPEISDDGRGLIWTGDAATLEVNDRHLKDCEGRFQATLHAVMMMLQRDRRATYRTLKYVLRIDDALLSAICKELRLRRLAIDEEGEVLVWTGETPQSVQPGEIIPSQQNTGATATMSPASPAPQPHVATADTSTNESPASQEEELLERPPSDENTTAPQPIRSAPEAERRQLTVMFCDLVGSTDLSGRLDPEDLREVVRAYQETAAEVIEHYEGYIAQYLGDGLLVYFGYPVAHEDDAQRAVHTGLGIVEAMAELNTRLKADHGVELSVRIGIHTGPVVVGQIGGGDRHENLALGETPNIAARLEGLAKPNTVVISPATAQLVQRSLGLEALGPHALKGVAEPMLLYAVVSTRESKYDDYETMLSVGFDALVGRDEEIGLLMRRWEQSKTGLGQVILLSGEAGIGKSSLLNGLRQHVRQEGMKRIAFHCSPYYTSTALYPIIDRLPRLLGWSIDEPVDSKLAKLEQELSQLSVALETSVPLLAALLSLSLSATRYDALSLDHQHQRQQTQDVLVAWMLEMAERRPTLVSWEDLHWADPSTLELLGLILEQTPTAPMLHVLTYRPEFHPPWRGRSHMTPITLNRLEPLQVEAIIAHLSGEKGLPSEIVDHIIAKTDGVPLYVEELTKMILNLGILQETTDRYVLTGSFATDAIPETLQDSLMARLDQLDVGKEVAQYGAVLGREFDYEMLLAVAPHRAATLQDALTALTAAEILYPRGQFPRVRYTFKHALIRDAAYQSLLRSTRQHVHYQVTQLLEARYPETIVAQPELVAQHYMGADCAEQASHYWQRAAERAAQQSATEEAIRHCNQSLTLLATLPETAARIQQKLDIHMLLGPALMSVKGWAAPEVINVYNHAYELCQRLEETPQLFPVIWGLWRFYLNRSEMRAMRGLMERLVSISERETNPALLQLAHGSIGESLARLGEYVDAYRHFEQTVVFTDIAQQQELAVHYAFSPLVQGLTRGAIILWYLGYPEQALKQSQQAWTVVDQLNHPLSLAYALFHMSRLLVLCGDIETAEARLEQCIALSSEHQFKLFAESARVYQGYIRAQNGQIELGIAQICQGLHGVLETGHRLALPINRCLLAEVYGMDGQSEAGLREVAEAQAHLNETGQHYYEPELYRIQGELWLKRTPTSVCEAENCFQNARDIAIQQRAKSWELRAATSLARLWQSQGKRQDANDLLAPVYSWFTEGFDTADLIDARALLDELSEDR